jgi:hypothetical protein
MERRDLVESISEELDVEFFCPRISLFVVNRNEVRPLS